MQGQVHQTEGILTLHYNERRAEKMNNSKTRKNKKTGALRSLNTSAPLQSTTNIDDEDEVNKIINKFYLLNKKYDYLTIN